MWIRSLSSSLSLSLSQFLENLLAEVNILIKNKKRSTQTHEAFTILHNLTEYSMFEMHLYASYRQFFFRFSCLDFVFSFSCYSHFGFIFGRTSAKSRLETCNCNYSNNHILDLHMVSHRFLLSFIFVCGYVCMCVHDMVWTIVCNYRSMQRLAGKQTRAAACFYA